MITDVRDNTCVYHKSFGEGKVINIDNGTITVKFSDGEKKFQFPGAFTQGFLHV